VRGTWETSGPDLGPVGGVAVLAVLTAAAYAVAEWVLAWLWLIAVVTGACAVLAVALALVVLPRAARWRDRRDVAGYEAQRPAWLAAEPVRQVPRTAPQAVEPRREVHLHLNVTPDQLAAIVRHHLEENR
jgi:hypothetical protein